MHNNENKLHFALHSFDNIWQEWSLGEQNSFSTQSR